MPQLVGLGHTPFAVVDVETTGFSPWLHDRVLEVAVVKVDPWRGILDEYSTLVNPGRDVGPSEIHYITAADVVAAPPFAAVAGDIFEHLHGCVVVGHNARFDLGFLAAEFAHAGVAMPPVPAVCTISLGKDLFPALASRKLFHCCTISGISIEDEHTALCDAKATAHLLAFYIATAMQRGAKTMQELGCQPLLIPDPWCPIPPSGLRLTRSGAAVAQSAQRGYLARLVEHLPETGSGDPNAESYLDLLDRALEDRKVTTDEADALIHTAEQWGLTRTRVLELHRRYLSGLARIAKADGIVTAAERRDLDLVCELLGLHRAALETLLEDDADPAAAGAAPASAPGQLAGLSVCFTGELRSTLKGQPISRELAEALAARAGLFVRGGVSKKLDLLVVADPDTMSGKAKKARDYGTRIMAEATFWNAIGLQVG